MSHRCWPWEVSTSYLFGGVGSWRFCLVKWIHLTLCPCESHEGHLQVLKSLLADGPSKAVRVYLVFVTVVFLLPPWMLKWMHHQQALQVCPWNSYRFLLFKPKPRILVGDFPLWFLTTGIRANRKVGCRVRIWAASDPLNLAGRVFLIVSE